MSKRSKFTIDCKTDILNFISKFQLDLSHIFILFIKKRYLRKRLKNNTIKQNNKKNN